MKFKSLGYYLKAFLLTIGVVLIFTLIDYLTHHLNSAFAVPEYYYRNKVIFATIFVFVIYVFTEKMKLIPRAFLISAITVILLQIKYYVQGYPKWFVFLFLGLHFLMLLVPAWLGFKLSKKYKWIKS